MLTSIKPTKQKESISFCVCIFRNDGCILHFWCTISKALFFTTTAQAIRCWVQCRTKSLSLVRCCISDQHQFYARTLCVLCPPADPQEAVLEDKVNAEVKLYIHDCLKVSIFQQTPDSTVPQCGCCQVSTWLFGEIWIPQPNQKSYFLLKTSAFVATLSCAPPKR